MEWVLAVLAVRVHTASVVMPVATTAEAVGSPSVLRVFQDPGGPPSIRVLTRPAQKIFWWLRWRAVEFLLSCAQRRTSTWSVLRGESRTRCHLSSIVDRSLLTLRPPLAASQCPVPSWTGCSRASRGPRQG